MRAGAIVNANEFDTPPEQHELKADRLRELAVAAERNGEGDAAAEIRGLAALHADCAVKQRLGVYIRWMIRRDAPEVFDIEERSFEFPWSDEDFTRCLRQRNCIPMVAEHSERIVGYMIYELHRNRFHILNFAVHPDFRRRGVGEQLVRKLTNKLAPQRRTRIMLEVRESNLSAQLFFRQLGFRAISVLREFYEETPEDAYLMQYRLTDAC
jgi:[ribosomal protein S18]-alanine N-acetyltransferase